MFESKLIQLQFACCLVQCILWFIPVLIIRHAMMKDPRGSNNSNPREQYDSLPEYAVRALNAHTNTQEGFVWFGFAILANLYGNGNDKAASILATIYTLCRIIYLPMYISNFSALRTTIWNIGFLATLAIFVLPFVSS